MEKYLATKAIAKGVFMQVAQLFQQHKVTPTPINYAVFYEFCLAKNTDLVKVINESLKSKDGFTDIVGYRAYQQYIKSVPEDIVHVGDDMADASKNLVDTLTEVVVHVNSHLELINSGASNEDLSNLRRSIDATQFKALKAVKEAKSAQDKVSHVASHVNRDPVTKLYSRIKLEQDYLALKSAGVSPCLILFDMDGFSEINKKHGALVSENLLRHIGKAIKEVAGSKHAYRIGGHDEFCVMTGAPMGDPIHNEIANKVSALIANISLRKKGTTEVIAKGMTATTMLFTSDSVGIMRGYEEAKKEMRTIKRNKRIARQKKEGGSYA